MTYNTLTKTEIKRTLADRRIKSVTLVRSEGEIRSMVLHLSGDTNIRISATAWQAIQVTDE